MNFEPVDKKVTERLPDLIPKEPPSKHSDLERGVSKVAMGVDPIGVGILAVFVMAIKDEEKSAPSNPGLYPNEIPSINTNPQKKINPGQSYRPG